MATRVGKQQLLDRAIELFRAKGYAATSIDDIVKACGITKGSLYHHFSGKEALALAAMDQVHRHFDAHIFGPLRDAEPPDATALARLNEAVETFFTEHPDGCLLANLSLEAGVDNPLFMDRIRQFFDDWRACYQAAFATRHGEEKARAMAEDSVATVQGCILMHRIDGNLQPLHRQHQRLIDWMVTG